MSNNKPKFNGHAIQTYGNEITVFIEGDMKKRFSELFKKTLSKKGIPLNEFRIMLAALTAVHECAKEAEKRGEI